MDGVGRVASGTKTEQFAEEIRMPRWRDNAQGGASVALAMDGESDCHGAVSLTCRRGYDTFLTRWIGIRNSYLVLIPCQMKTQTSQVSLEKALH